MNCPVCGNPSRETAFRPQGGGQLASFCSDDCYYEASRKRTASWQKTPRGKFVNQRDRAKERGIDWEFTFEQWMAWWGDDLAYRGVTKHDLCMARYNDEGPYSPDNCRKITISENCKERQRLRYG